MSLFDKIFRKKSENKKHNSSKNVTLEVALDTLFVQQFKDKGGKFLYATQKEEILEYLQSVFEENVWESALCFDRDLITNLDVINIKKADNAKVFYTTCEHLVVEDGSILFSSNQLKDAKLTHYPINFIVFAKTSQLIHNKDKALSSIKHRFKKEIPFNISPIKDYLPYKKDPNFLSYGNTNSKNLYLLLLEDL